MLRFLFVTAVVALLALLFFTPLIKNPAVKPNTPNAQATAVRQTKSVSVALSYWGKTKCDSQIRIVYGKLADTKLAVSQFYAASLSSPTYQDCSVTLNSARVRGLSDPKFCGVM